MTQFAFIVGLLIIVGLAIYAVYLLLRLRKQQQEIATAKQQKTIKAQQKIDEINADIQYISKAMLEERCELSEGVVRIVKLLEQISMSESMATEIPAIFAHYQVIESHPIMDARKKLDKQQRMKLDLERMKSESSLASNILEDAKKLIDFKDKKH